MTCPYCKLLSETKFLHKQHLRQEHYELFSNNIKTSITGNDAELDCKKFEISRLTIIGYRMASDFGIVLDCADKSGQNYQVQFSDDLIQKVPGTTVALMDLTKLKSLDILDIPLD